ncbi:MAG: PTS system mannose/fructose/sorbose family transporter subunit IID [bacterium]|nr:PTS system mannose/fructose/sorbose family transporter subunit IID [bacterium]
MASNGNTTTVPPLGVRLATLWRSMFIQCTNNFEAMLSLGAAYTMFPMLKWLYGGDTDGLKAALQRNSGFFNTHPYFANCILGVIGRLEIRRAPEGPSFDEIKDIKSAMSGAFGGLGDSLFWATLMPLAALAGLITYIGRPQYALVGVVVALVVYTIPHFYVRYYFMERGQRDGTEVVVFLRKINLPRLIVFASFVVVFLLAIYTVLMLWIPITGGGSGYLAAGLSVLIIVLMQIRVDKKTIPAEILWYLVIIVSLPFSFILSSN